MVSQCVRPGRRPATPIVVQGAIDFASDPAFLQNTPTFCPEDQRNHDLHEYQSKQLFAEYGIPVPEGVPADTPEAAAAATDTLGGDLWVVKAQVHAGGRGKAGGVSSPSRPMKSGSTPRGCSVRSW